MSEPVRILGVTGSLRRASHNRAALRAAMQLLPQGAALDILELDGIPGVQSGRGAYPPAKVLDLKKRIPYLVRYRVAWFPR